MKNKIRTSARKMVVSVGMLGTALLLLLFSGNVPGQQANLVLAESAVPTILEVGEGKAFQSIKTAVDSITPKTLDKSYEIRVYPYGGSGGSEYYDMVKIEGIKGTAEQSLIIKGITENGKTPIVDLYDSEEFAFWVTGSEYVTIDNFQIQNVTNSLVNITRPGGNITVSNNILTANSGTRGINVDAGLGVITMKGNTVTDGVIGIYARETNQVFFEGNTITKNALGLRLAGNLDLNQLTNNKIYNNTKSTDFGQGRDRINEIEGQNGNCREVCKETFTEGVIEVGPGKTFENVSKALSYVQSDLTGTVTLKVYPGVYNLENDGSIDVGNIGISGSYKQNVVTSEDKKLIFQGVDSSGNPLTVAPTNTDGKNAPVLQLKGESKVVLRTHYVEVSGMLFLVDTTYPYSGITFMGDNSVFQNNTVQVDTCSYRLFPPSFLGLSNNLLVQKNIFKRGEKKGDCTGVYIDRGDNTKFFENEITGFQRGLHTNRSVYIKGNTIHDNLEIGVFYALNETKPSIANKFEGNTLYKNGGIGVSFVDGIFGDNRMNTCDQNITGNNVYDNNNGKLQWGGVKNQSLCCTPLYKKKGIACNIEGGADRYNSCENPLQIKKDGTGDYTSINAALKDVNPIAVGRSCTLQVYPGLYDLNEEGSIDIVKQVSENNTIIIQGVDTNGNPLTEAPKNPEDAGVPKIKITGESSFSLQSSYLKVEGLSFLMNSPRGKNVINVLGENSVFQNNTIQTENTDYNSLYITGNNALIQKNSLKTVGNKGGSGILLRNGSNVKIFENEVQGFVNGILVVDKGTAHVKGNIVHHNRDLGIGYGVGSNWKTPSAPKPSETNTLEGNKVYDNESVGIIFHPGMYGTDPSNARFLPKTNKAYKVCESNIINNNVYRNNNGGDQWGNIKNQSMCEDTGNIEGDASDFNSCENPITVKKDGTGDYTTINDVFPDISPIAVGRNCTIHVYPGLYDLSEEGKIAVKNKRTTAEKHIIIQGVDGSGTPLTEVSKDANDEGIPRIKITEGAKNFSVQVAYTEIKGLSFLVGIPRDESKAIYILGTNTVFQNNIVEVTSCGYVLFLDAKTTVQNNSFKSGEEKTCVAIYVGKSSENNIQDSSIIENEIQGFDRGIVMTRYAVTTKGNKIHDNNSGILYEGHPGNEGCRYECGVAWPMEKSKLEKNMIYNNGKGRINSLVLGGVILEASNPGFPAGCNPFITGNVVGNNTPNWGRFIDQSTCEGSGNVDDLPVENPLSCESPFYIDPSMRLSENGKNNTYIAFSEFFSDISPVDAQSTCTIYLKPGEYTEDLKVHPRRVSDEYQLIIQALDETGTPQTSRGSVKFLGNINTGGSKNVQLLGLLDNCSAPLRVQGKNVYSDAPYKNIEEALKEVNPVGVGAKCVIELEAGTYQFPLIKGITTSEEYPLEIRPATGSENQVILNSRPAVNYGRTTFPALDIETPYVTFKGLTIDKSQNHGVRIAAENVTLERNMIKNSAMMGIAVGDVKNIVIKDNTIENNRQSGIKFFSSSINIRGNTIIENDQSGVDIEKTIATKTDADCTTFSGINQNKIYNNKGSAFTDTAYDLLKCSELENYEGDPDVTLDCKEPVVVGPEEEFTSVNQVLKRVSRRFSKRDCIIELKKDYEFLETITIKNVTPYEDKKLILRSQSTDGVVGRTILDSRFEDYGVRVESTDNLLIENFDILRSKVGGVHVLNSKNVQFSNVRVFEHNVENNKVKTYGIQVETSEGVVIDQSEIKDSTVGIYLSGKKNTLSSVGIFDNETGIEIDGDEMKVVSSFISENSKSGIYVKSGEDQQIGGTKEERNIIKKNGLDGIYVNKVHDIKSNLITHNGQYGMNFYKKGFEKTMSNRIADNNIYLNKGGAEYNGIPSHVGVYGNQEGDASLFHDCKTPLYVGENEEVTDLTSALRKISFGFSLKTCKIILRRGEYMEGVTIGHNTQADRKLIIEAEKVDGEYVSAVINARFDDMAITIEKPFVEIRGITIQNAKKNGIAITSENVILDSVTVENSEENNIVATTVQSIFKNLIITGGKNGIVLNGNANTVTESRIENAVSGLLITGDLNTVTQNKVQFNTKGIVVKGVKNSIGGEDSFEKAGNIISENNGIGIEFDRLYSGNISPQKAFIDGVGNTFLGNTVELNTGVGLRVVSQSGIYTGVTFRQVGNNVFFENNNSGEQMSGIPNQIGKSGNNAGAGRYADCKTPLRVNPDKARWDKTYYSSLDEALKKIHFPSLPDDQSCNVVVERSFDNYEGGIRIKKEGTTATKKLIIEGAIERRPIIDARFYQFGIHLDETEYITLKNFQILNSKVEGILIKGGGSHMLENISVSQHNNTRKRDTFAVKIEGSSLNTIEGSQLKDSFAGVFIDGQHNKVFGSVMTNNIYGVHIAQNSFDNIIGGTEEGKGNTLSENDSDGIYAIALYKGGPFPSKRPEYTNAPKNSIIGNSLVKNGRYGINTDQPNTDTVGIVNTEFPLIIVSNDVYFNQGGQQYGGISNQLGKNENTAGDPSLFADCTKVLEVGEKKEYYSIQHAIDKIRVTNTSCTVKVYPGFYEPFVIQEKEMMDTEPRIIIQAVNEDGGDIVLGGIGSNKVVIDARFAENGVVIASDRVTISGLEIKNARSENVILSGKDILFQKNKVRGHNIGMSYTKLFGISVTGENVRVLDNTVADNQKGIWMEGKNNVVEKNTVRDNELGIVLVSVGNTVKENIVKDNKYFGVHAYNLIEKVGEVVAVNTIEGNQIYENYGYGLGVGIPEVPGLPEKKVYEQVQEQTEQQKELLNKNKELAEGTTNVNYYAVIRNNNIYFNEGQFQYAGIKDQAERNGNKEGDDALYETCATPIKIMPEASAVYPAPASTYYSFFDALRHIRTTIPATCTFEIATGDYFEAVEVKSKLTSPERKIILRGNANGRPVLHGNILDTIIQVKNVNYTVLENLMIKGAPAYGISTLYDEQAPALQNPETDHRIEIRNVTITSPQYDNGFSVGISHQGDRALIEKVKVTQNSKMGIRLEGNDNIVRSSFITENGTRKWDIRQVQGQDSKVAKSEALSEGYGVLVLGDRNSIYGNVIAQNTGHGININGKNNIIGYDDAEISTANKSTPHYVRKESEATKQNNISAAKWLEYEEEIQNEYTNLIYDNKGNGILIGSEICSNNFLDLKCTMILDGDEQMNQITYNYIYENGRWDAGERMDGNAINSQNAYPWIAHNRVFHNIGYGLRVPPNGLDARPDKFDPDDPQKGRIYSVQYNMVYKNQKGDYSGIQSQIGLNHNTINPDEYLSCASELHIGVGPKYRLHNIYRTVRNIDLNIQYDEAKEKDRWDTWYRQDMLFASKTDNEIRTIFDDIHGKDQSTKEISETEIKEGAGLADDEPLTPEREVKVKRFLLKEIKRRHEGNFEQQKGKIQTLSDQAFSADEIATNVGKRFGEEFDLSKDGYTDCRVVLHGGDTFEENIYFPFAIEGLERSYRDRWLSIRPAKKADGTPEKILIDARDFDYGIEVKAFDEFKTFARLKISDIEIMGARKAGIYAVGDHMTFENMRIADSFNGIEIIGESAHVKGNKIGHFAGTYDPSTGKRTYQFETKDFVPVSIASKESDVFGNRTYVSGPHLEDVDNFYMRNHNYVKVVESAKESDPPYFGTLEYSSVVLRGGKEVVVNNSYNIAAGDGIRITGTASDIQENMIQNKKNGIVLDFEKDLQRVKERRGALNTWMGTIAKNEVLHNRSYGVIVPPYFDTGNFSENMVGDNHDGNSKGVAPETWIRRNGNTFSKYQSTDAEETTFDAKTEIIDAKQGSTVRLSVCPPESSTSCDFISIQEALNRVPNHIQGNYIISVEAGEYIDPVIITPKGGSEEYSLEIVAKGEVQMNAVSLAFQDGSELADPVYATQPTIFFQNGYDRKVGYITFRGEDGGKFVIRQSNISVLAEDGVHHNTISDFKISYADGGIVFPSNAHSNSFERNMIAFSNGWSGDRKRSYSEKKTDPESGACMKLNKYGTQNGVISTNVFKNTVRENTLYWNYGYGVLNNGDYICDSDCRGFTGDKGTQTIAKNVTGNRLSENSAGEYGNMVDMTYFSGNTYGRTDENGKGVLYDQATLRDFQAYAEGEANRFANEEDWGSFLHTDVITKHICVADDTDPMCDYYSLQEAVDRMPRAMGGTREFLLHPGIYTEQVFFDLKTGKDARSLQNNVLRNDPYLKIELRALPGKEGTAILEAGTGNDVFHFREEFPEPEIADAHPLWNNITIDGLTFRNSRSGVDVRGDNITISNSIFINNEIGVQLSDKGSRNAQIVDSVFTGNKVAIIGDTKYFVAEGNEIKRNGTGIVFAGCSTDTTSTAAKEYFHENGEYPCWERINLENNTFEENTENITSSSPSGLSAKKKIDEKPVNLKDEGIVGALKNMLAAMDKSGKCEEFTSYLRNGEFYGQDGLIEYTSKENPWYKVRRDTELVSQLGDISKNMERATKHMAAEVRKAKFRKESGGENSEELLISMLEAMGTDEAKAMIEKVKDGTANYDEVMALVSGQPTRMSSMSKGLAGGDEIDLRLFEGIEPEISTDTTLSDEFLKNIEAKSVREVEKKPIYSSYEDINEALSREPGDVNNDGKTTPRDALYLYKSLQAKKALTLIERMMSDSDNDGQVADVDVEGLLNYFLQK